MDKPVRSLRSKRSNKFVVALLYIVLVSLVFGGTIFALRAVNADNTYCQPIDGYQLITSRMAIDASGNPVFILRGLILTGEGSVGGKSITIPPCGSNDSGVQVMNNIFITLDGQKYILAAGSIGRDTLPNPTQAPQP